MARKQNSAEYSFFFQAEDGIRDVAVTGVQTCALPISQKAAAVSAREKLSGRKERKAKAAKLSPKQRTAIGKKATAARDRKSTRLNSSHGYISYAVFCLKKKKKKIS